MREELSFDELAAVNGGKYVVNGNTKQVAFLNVRKCYKLKCSPYQAMELMDSLIGQYPTEEEYDNACIAALSENDWI